MHTLPRTARSAQRSRLVPALGRRLAAAHLSALAITTLSLLASAGGDSWDFSDPGGPWELSGSDRGSMPPAGLTFSSKAPDGTGAGGWTSARPDGHAPIGVMADHLHCAGEWMISVRTMHMHMDGMRNNTNGLSSSAVLNEGYMVTPTEMDMDMLMVGGMYAPTDRLTLAVMVPYIWNEMDHRTAAGTDFTTKSDGIGDVRLTGLLGVLDANHQRVHLNLGLSIPTGDIDEKDNTPAAKNAKLPYPMQLGTGTFDVLPGLTYLGQRGDWSWGAQTTLRIHIGNNDEGYRRGNRLEATAWGARRFGQFSGSLRLAAAHWNNIHGQDDDLNPAMVPTADPDRQAGDRVDALVGLNYHVGGNSALRGNRLALEIGAPVYQDLDGPQLETDWLATIGWQVAF